MEISKTYPEKIVGEKIKKVVFPIGESVAYVEVDSGNLRRHEKINIETILVLKDWELLKGLLTKIIAAAMEITEGEVPADVIFTKTVSEIIN